MEQWEADWDTGSICHCCHKGGGRIRHADISWPAAEAARLKLPLRAHYGGLPAYQWEGWLHPDCEAAMVEQLERKGGK